VKKTKSIVNRHCLASREPIKPNVSLISFNVQVALYTRTNNNNNKNNNHDHCVPVQALCL